MEILNHPSPGYPEGTVQWPTEFKLLELKKSVRLGDETSSKTLIISSCHRTTPPPQLEGCLFTNRSCFFTTRTQVRLSASPYAQGLGWWVSEGPCQWWVTLVPVSVLKPGTVQLCVCKFVKRKRPNNDPLQPLHHPTTDNDSTAQTVWELAKLLVKALWRHDGAYIVTGGGGSGGGSISAASHLCCTLAPSTEHGPRAELCAWEPVLRRRRRRECCKWWRHQSFLSSCWILGALEKWEGRGEETRRQHMYSVSSLQWM